jgi:protein TonB
MAFAQTRAANPGALGLTIGLNAATVLALALWNPNIIKIFDHGGITTIDVPPIKEPPPPPPENAEKVRTKIDTVKPTIEGGRSDTIIWPDPHPDPGIVIKDPGPGTIIEPPPPPTIHEIAKRPPIMATAAGELQPPYPPGLQRLGTEGSVTVRILVGANGRPADIVLVRGDHPDFFAAAKSWGMRHWRFKPAAEDEKAVEGWYTLTVKFDIE